MPQFTARLLFIQAEHILQFTHFLIAFQFIRRIRVPLELNRVLFN